MNKKIKNLEIKIAQNRGYTTELKEKQMELEKEIKLNLDLRLTKAIEWIKHNINNKEVLQNSIRISLNAFLQIKSILRDSDLMKASTVEESYNEQLKKLNSKDLEGKSINPEGLKIVLENGVAKYIKKEILDKTKPTEHFMVHITHCPQCGFRIEVECHESEKSCLKCGNPKLPDECLICKKKFNNYYCENCKDNIFHKTHITLLQGYMKYKNPIDKIKRILINEDSGSEKVEESSKVSVTANVSMQEVGLSTKSGDDSKLPKPTEFKGKFYYGYCPIAEPDSRGEKEGDMLVEAELVKKASLTVLKSDSTLSEPCNRCDHLIENINKYGNFYCRELDMKMDELVKKCVHFIPKKREVKPEKTKFVVEIHTYSHLFTKGFEKGYRKGMEYQKKELFKEFEKDWNFLTVKTYEYINKIKDNVIKPDLAKRMIEFYTNSRRRKMEK